MSAGVVVEELHDPGAQRDPVLMARLIAAVSSEVPSPNIMSSTHPSKACE